MTYGIKMEGDSYKHFRGSHKVVATRLSPISLCCCPKYATAQVDDSVEGRLFLPVKDKGALTRKKRKPILLTKLQESSAELFIFKFECSLL